MRCSVDHPGRSDERGGHQQLGHSQSDAAIWWVADLLRGDCEQSDDGQMILHTVLHSFDGVPDTM
jgi:hypothetical protein